MWNVRRVLPGSDRYGSHAAHVVCHAACRYARGSTAQQHSMDLCLLLPLRSALPTGGPYCRRNVYLKGMASKAKLYRNSTAPHFSETFVYMVETFGRSYELGLVALHYLRHFPLRLPGMLPMGFGMVTKGRMAIPPTRIKHMDQLKKILDRAKQLELTS